MAEGVAGDSAGKVEFFCGIADGALEDGFVEMVAAGLLGFFMLIAYLFGAVKTAKSSFLEGTALNHCQKGPCEP